MYFDKLDLDLWKYIQDKFAKEIGLGIYTIDREGHEVAGSGERPFLLQLIRSKRKDILKDRCYRQLNEMEEDEIAMFKMFGTVNLISPVVLHDKMIGAVVCGPIRKDEYDYQELAARLGIEKHELEDAADEIKEVSQEQVDLYRRMISILSGILPKLSYQKQTRDTEINELKALQSIIRMVNSTLELDEVLHKIMAFLINSLNATDCCVFVETEDGEKKYCYKKEVENLIRVEKAVSKKAIEEDQIITVRDISTRFGVSVVDNYNSMLSIPLKHRDKIIGSINLYGKNFGEISDDSLNFMSVMRDQIALAVANAQRYGQVKELAVVDKLTGLYNRRYFAEMLDKRLEGEVNVEQPIALILLDIDNFGHYNNAHGHPKGDELLRDLSRLIKTRTRDEDVAGRYGGEEFVVLMPGLKSNDAMEAAKRIKNAVAEHKFEGGESQPGGKVTISLGLVSCMDKVSSSDLIKEADAALYKAKEEGKNRVMQRIILKNNLRTEASSDA
jgi:diguanylate cyclase (GGDEF)-like protein